MTVELILGAVALLIAIGFSLTNKMSKAQTEQRGPLLRRFGEENGFSFIPSEPEFSKRIEHFQFFDRAFDDRGASVLRKTCEEVPVEMVDYDFHIEVSRRKLRRCYTLVHLPFESQLPHFIIEPKRARVQPKFLSFASGVEFDSHPEFSARYHLHGEIDYAVRAFFTDHLLDYFEEMFVNYLEVGPHGILYIPTNSVLPPESIESIVVKALHIRNTLLSDGAWSNGSSE